MQPENGTAGRPGVLAGQRLTLAYGSRVALRDVDFTLHPGTVTALVGPNGSGKSSLLSAIAGLLPPTAGTLELGGRPLREVRPPIAYVLQAANGNELLPVTVREVVAMGRFGAHGLFGRLGPDDRRAVAEAMERLEVTDLAERHLRELSGGQRQRVLVAQGLAQQAGILLLDEPVTGLDLVSRARIIEAVAAERRAGRLVVLSTHDLEDAELADQVLLLAGRVVAAGPPAEALTAAALRRAYGGRLLHDEHLHAHGA